MQRMRSTKVESGAQNQSQTQTLQADFAESKIRTKMTADNGCHCSLHLQTPTQYTSSGNRDYVSWC